MHRALAVYAFLWEQRSTGSKIIIKDDDDSDVLTLPHSARPIALEVL